MLYLDDVGLCEGIVGSIEVDFGVRDENVQTAREECGSTRQVVETVTRMRMCAVVLSQ